VIHLLRSEWIKFRSVRSTVITLLIGGVIVVLVAVLTAVQANDDSAITCVAIEDAAGPDATPTTVDPAAPVEQTVPADGGTTIVVDGGQVIDENFCGPGFRAEVGSPATNLSGLTGGVTFAALIFGVLGVQVIGQEYRFNTIRPTFTAAPKRLRVVAAKAIVVGVACSLVAAIMVAFCWVVGTVLIDDFVVDGTDRRVAWGIVLFTALWTTAGVGVGAIVRQPIAGILILIGYSLILENLIGALFDSTVKWLPYQNGLQMTLRLDDSDFGLQSVLSGGIYFAAVCFALLAIGMVLVDRRDA
jgi:ABC-2 type transport system permease protein